MKGKYKIIIAHPGRQHSFRLASALKRDSNFQIKYITTVYDKSNSIFMKVVKTFISNDNRQRANGRKNPDLSDNEVFQFCQLGGFIEIFLSRFDRKKNLYNAWHKINSTRFGIKVAKFAIKHQVDAVICYDTNAMECFSYLKQHAPHIRRILDSSAANRLFMKEIYQKDMKQSKRFSKKLKEEIGDSLKEERQEYYRMEMLYSQYILVPSNFVKKSYQYSGFIEQNIKVCPYGVELNNFSFTPRKVKSDKDPLHFVFVGGTKQLKGISYLLDAFLRIPKEKATLTIVGNCNLSEDLLKPYQNHVHFTGILLQSEVAEVLRDMDVMIFPSLGEGMSLSIIEALACGLPVVCTENSGTNDLIEIGKNGFIIPIQDVDAIIDRANWFLNNREMIPKMGKRGYDIARKYTWGKYNETVANSVREICETQTFKEKVILESN